MTAAQGRESPTVICGHDYAPPDRTRWSFSDRELTQLQETGTVLVNSNLRVDGVRLTAITAALLLLGIDADDVVLRSDGYGIAVTVKPDA